MDDEPLLTNPDLAYAVRMVQATCCLAGSASYLADIREDLRHHGIIRAVRDHDTPALFDWLIKTLSFQGISDTVAAGYIAEHGSVRWSEITDALTQSPSCPKLGGYWRFYDCRYHKGSHTCSESAHIEACPLPRHPLRNGRLNQMAYSLFLFMRDIADADFAGNDPKIADLTAQLPVGRVHATGRTFVPFIRRELYDQLLAAAANGAAHSSSSSDGSSGASGSAPGGSAPRLPRNWQEIGIGDLVVANQDRWEGWYEAIVTGVDGDMLTLRWRDYPRERRIVRHRFRLGLLYPNATVGKGSPAKTAGQAKHDKPATAHPVANDQSLPQNWDEVDINHVVLAKDDSQWGAWWEAIPVEKAGDSFKLRWREKYAANVPLITRPRLNLALLCPNAA